MKVYKFVFGLNNVYFAYGPTMQVALKKARTAAMREHSRATETEFRSAELLGELAQTFQPRHRKKA